MYKDCVFDQRIIWKDNETTLVHQHRHHVKYGMEWNRGMELWNGMEWVFGMEYYGMKILSNVFCFVVWSWKYSSPRGVRLKCYYAFFPGVLWLGHFLYSVGPHPVSSLHIYTFVVSRAFMADAASQAGDADSSRAPGLTSGVQGSMNVHRDALLLVPQWQCISSFVFYIGVRVKTVISWDERGHSHDNSYCLVLTQVQTSNIKLWQSS